MQRKMDDESKKLSALIERMDNIIAENRVLRRLAQVPDNYGFEIDSIKVAERSEIDECQAKIRFLKREVEELEGERTQLRNKLRTLSDLYDHNPKGGDRYKNLSREEL